MLGGDHDTGWNLQCQSPELMSILHPAYILHARLYRETSLLLEAFTRDHGRVGLVARGVRGGRGQALRAMLQPLQPLFLSWRGKGELMQLTDAEPAGSALALHGNALLSAFYINELLLRFLTRGDTHTALFWRYAECLGLLSTADLPLAWELRRFERDLLGHVGYALELSADAGSGVPLDPVARYHYDPESGPQRVTDSQGTAPMPVLGSISGTALIALANDVMPDAAELRELRRLMRGVLLHHLDGRELRSWRVLTDISASVGYERIRAPDPGNE